MNRTFTTIKSNVGSNIQDTSTSTATVIGRYINDTYFDLLRRTNFNLVDDDYSFSTVSGTQDYVLPDNFKKELYVHDATNLRELAPVSLQDLAERYTSTLTTSDAPERYVILYKPVQKQPSSSSTLSIVSSSASDTTQTLFVRGISSSVEITESITLTGTSTATSSNSFTEIISISKSAATAGKVTITSNAAAVTVAVIAPEVTDYRVSVIRFHQIPAGIYTIKMPYIINPSPLNNDYDMPLIDAADIIEKGATALAWKYKRQFAKAQEWSNDYEKSIIMFIWDRENSANKVTLFNPKPYSRDIY